jgi:hypothetical protein
VNLAGLLAYSLFVAFPSLLKQWLEERTVDRDYSYGDSAGFKPDFPFNPDCYTGNQIHCKCAVFIFKRQIFQCTIIVGKRKAASAAALIEIK